LRYQGGHLNSGTRSERAQVRNLASLSAQQRHHFARHFQCPEDTANDTHQVGIDLTTPPQEKKIDDAALDPCADMDQKPRALKKYRVMSDDLAVLIAEKREDLDLARGY